MRYDDRLTALAARGFGDRHAAFLALVLGHSGVFLKRQHATFLGVVDGAVTTHFCRHLLDARLATRHLYTGRTHVYHVSSPALYDAVGEPNSRLRRPAEPAALTQRLMTLDVLIVHRDQPCLATEREKVAYFTEVVGVPTEALPGRLYHSERSGVPPTRRYFVDRTPVLHGADRTTFVYVPGWAPLAAFASFLNAYDVLLRRVPRCQLLFCTADLALTARASRMWERRFGGLRELTDVPDRGTILAHFRARERFEARQFSSFTDEERAQLRRDLVRFSGPGYEQWYATFLAEGDTARPPEPFARRTDAGGPDVTFVPYLLTDNYPFLGAATEAA